MSDASDINIEIKPRKNYQIKNNNILESRLNSIQKNIEDVNFNKVSMTYQNKKIPILTLIILKKITIQI